MCIEVKCFQCYFYYVAFLKYLFGIIVLTVVIGFIYFFYDFTNKMHVEFSNIKAIDAVVVLAGDVGRIQKAINVFTEMRAQYLLISGVGKKFQIEKYAPNQKKNPNVIIENTSTSTVENAIECEKLLRQFSVRNILLVTSDYHMYRSLYIFKKILPKDLTIYPYSVENVRFSMDSWYSNLMNFIIVFKEFIKYHWSRILLSITI